MQDRQLSMLTYNVWVDNDYYPENQAGLINYFINSAADVICLQEVTQQFFELINENEILRSSYDFQAPRIVEESPCGGLLMVKKELKATFYPQRELHKSRSCRYLDYASFTLNGIKIAVGSVHLDSIFFTDRATDFKVEQLKQACTKLRAVDPDCMLIAGDMNFTSGEQLANENAALAKLELTDVWKELHSTTEDDQDQNYRDNDVTWDSAKNPNVEYADECQRPDRIFMRLFKPKKIEAKKIERVVTHLSDHYGVTSVFALKN